MAIDLQQWARPLSAFADWINTHNYSAAGTWARRLNSPNVETVEGAVAEAVIWDFIGTRCESTRLNDMPGTGGVDFEFTAQNQTFLVEVTNISTDAASAASGMPNIDPSKSFGFYGLLTKQIRQKVRRKLDQVQKQSKHPVLVAVTTLHHNASRACVDRRAFEFAMGSPPSIAFNWNPDTGAVEGKLYESTDLSQSVFLSPHPILGSDGAPVAQAKYQPISGFLIGGFGLSPSNVRVFGGLNPEALRPFDPAILPDIPFCSFREWPATSHVNFQWTISQQDEDEQERRARERRLRASGLGEFVDAIQQRKRFTK